MQKSLKSLQLVLNEFFGKLAEPLVIVTASAFTQARAKLSHTAFIELNQKAVAETYYKDKDYKTWRGFRVLSVDGSKIILPNEDEIRKYFGSVRIANQDKNVSGEYPVALASVLYDVLNNIALDSILSHAKAYEVNLAREHLDFVKENDLLLFDRNYPSYLFPAALTQQNTDFLGRCSRSSFKEARMMFEPDAEESRIAVLRPHHTKKKEIEALGLPAEIKVRFVRVVLDNGEVEVLVTSLTDETQYSVNDFKELYHLRWG
ncbi:MAG: IS4 family transposase, partial [Desulfobacteraceae bacterium]|nr:IS4 family transposase [Desulfobacteraceae bacterium]